MSILNDFENMRLYRKRAEHFDRLADDCLVAEERYRYRRVAHHYTALAEIVQRTDKARVTERLARLRSMREEIGRLPHGGQVPPHSTGASSE